MLLTKAGLKRESSMNTDDAFETLRQCEERKTGRKRRGGGGKRGGSGKKEQVR